MAEELCAARREWVLAGVQGAQRRVAASEGVRGARVLQEQQYIMELIEVNIIIHLHLN